MIQEWSALDEQVKDIQASLEHIQDKDREGAVEVEGKEGASEKAVHGSDSESDSDEEEDDDEGK